MVEMKKAYQSKINVYLIKLQFPHMIDARLHTSSHEIFLFLCCSAMYFPQPYYSAFREASFGHGILDIKNRTHAYFAWHRNEDGYDVISDSLWLTNRYWYPTDDSN